MPIFSHYKPDKSLVIRRLVGAVDLGAIVRSLADHVADPLYDPDMAEIADLGRLEDLQLDFHAMRSIVRTKDKIYGVRKTVSVYAPGDVAFGMARMYQSLAEIDAGVRAVVSRTEAEALAVHNLGAGSLRELLDDCVARPCPPGPDSGEPDMRTSI
ncbi:hypothetical protein KUH32_16595 [Thalassococcus sp. CAU 1522]|uniref:Uncharacterized protein n=1 Tax=Thalassococcus arenae TaxID=2851652 RepID=A0ABS6NBK0_9RHOB|nr:hypothetical protein [Thalassococcus arenae]MBV2361385.1 hypothetical protein [Thalassococcus arenae]